MKSEGMLGGEATGGLTGGNGETVIGGRTVEHTVQQVRGLGRVHMLRDVTAKRRSEELRLRLERPADRPLRVAVACR